MPFGTQRGWLRYALPRPEILSYPLETNVIDSVVLNASGVMPDASGPYFNRRYLLAGTVLSKRTDNTYERFTNAGAVAASAEVDTVTLNGATSGQFVIANGTDETPPLAFNAAAADVQAALAALPGLAGTTVTGAAGGPYTITGPVGTTLNLRVLTGPTSGTGPTGTGASAGLNQGATATTAVTTPANDGTGAQAVAGILFDTVEFADGSSTSDEPVAMLRRNVSFQAAKIIDFAAYSAQIEAALPSCEFI